jgi:hypothetical protein
MTDNTGGFASPAQMAGLDYEAALGHLLILDVTEYVESVKTTLGDKPAVRANVIDVDDPDLSAEDALIFPLVLVGSLRPRVGQRVLGRLAQGVAKPGQNAPWILEDAVGNPEDVKAAQAALAALQPVTGATPKAKAKPAARSGAVPF